MDAILVVRWGEQIDGRPIGRAHAFAAAVPAQFTASVGYGRGERSSADTLRVNVRSFGEQLAERAG